jgi:hypothetical protein
MTGNTQARRHRRRAGWSLLASSLALAACGGGGDFDDLGTDIACAFVNCKESEAVAVSDISPRYEVSQSGSRVSAHASLGYRSNLITVVRLGGADTLTMEIGSMQRRMQPTDESRFDSASFLDNQPATPTVAITFSRGGQPQRSTVTLPATFSVLSPVGPVTLAKSAGQLLVQVSTPPVETLATRLSGTCTRSDASGNFAVSANMFGAALLGPAPQGTSYRIDTLALDAAVNALGIPANTPDPAALPDVVSCELQITFRRELRGASAPGMHDSGTIVGVTQQAIAVSYRAMN